MDVQRLQLEADLLGRLLDPADPSLRAKVLADLLDRPESDPELTAARARIPAQKWVKATLDAHNGDGTWGRGFYAKYDGTSWVLLHLSEVGATADLAPIRAGVERLLADAKPVTGLKGIRASYFEGFTDGVYWQFPAACLTAHQAMALIRFGELEHPVTRRALATCRHLLDPEQGFGCFVMEQSLLPACFMTVPKVLKAFLAIPESSRAESDVELIQRMVGLLKKYHLYRYVARESRAWQDWVHRAGIEAARREKPVWLAEGRADPRREKDGWLRFSFPHSYNSDVLEVLLLLGQAGCDLDEVVAGGLEQVLAKRRKNGMWNMVGGLNGKMHADLDRKGAASPWITYRALLAFKQFGLLEVGR